MLRKDILFRFFIFIMWYCFIYTIIVQKGNAQILSSALTLQHSGLGDQDDMCIWIHPSDPSQSTVISSDKDANRLFVYNLKGDVIQTVSVSGQPGNIDARYNFTLGGEKVDIIGYCDRGNSAIVLYKINNDTRQLSLAGTFHAGNWPEEIYGFCFYVNQEKGKYYAIACGKSSQMRQWELVDNGDGTINGVEKRTWTNGTDKTEGLVADDETSKLYAANEKEGIYKYDADPADLSPKGELIAPTGGPDGLKDDVEGITIYYAAGGAGYIIASSQGSDDFKIYDRAPPHNFLGSFKINGVGGTDGIDVTNVSLGTTFSKGIFTCHNSDKSPPPVEVVKWEDIASAVGGMLIDTTYWNPRGDQTGVELNRIDEDVPRMHKLYQNHPNPFNHTTVIRYSLAKSEHVKLTVYDIMGRKVWNLLDEFQSAGTYRIQWSAFDNSDYNLPSGIYFCHIQAGSFVKTLKMILML